MRNPPFWGALLGLCTVALGAFGAHTLEDSFDAHQLDSWRTGVRYTALHAAALLALRDHPRPAAVLFAGTVLFSGGLFAWCLLQLKPLVFVAPVGGTVLLIGWTWVAVSVYRS